MFPLMQSCWLRIRCATLKALISWACGPSTFSILKRRFHRYIGDAPLMSTYASIHWDGCLRYHTHGAYRAVGITLETNRVPFHAKCVQTQQTSNQRAAHPRKYFERLGGLCAAHDANQRAQDTRGSTAQLVDIVRLGKQAVIARGIGNTQIENTDLT